MSKYLEKLETEQRLQGSSFCRGKRFLELGAGCALVGLVASCLGKCSLFQSNQTKYEIFEG